MPVSVKVSMWSVTTEALPGADRLEQIAVGHQAQALIPRVIAGLEVRVDVISGRQLRFHALAHQPLHQRAAGGGRAGSSAIVSSTFFQRTIG